MMKHVKPLMAALAAAGMISLAVFAHAGDTKECDQDQPLHHQRGADVDGEKGAHGFDGDGRKFGGARHMHGEKHRPPFEKILDLTDAQKKTLEAERTEQEASQKAFHEKLRGAHEALDKAADANSDDATINKLSNEFASLIAQQEVTRIKMRKQFLSLLTAEQKQKLDAFEAERKGAREEKSKRSDSSQTK